MSRSTEELRERIAGLRKGEERMDQLDWMHRQWVASMMADACIIADELEDRLNHEEHICLNSALRGQSEHDSAKHGDTEVES